ncbi:NAD-dependent epimerase/dehydratase family protein [Aurantibacillus circumpalustris]|uniref:NAD-dependent epimerase/dehydratase family protein n=1 Tax=Aurantibacillus circumpalustris TaxID=3036359 RepID=UPI00295BB949|nr:NAD-dependent epimerase/dehydratase family protein [Aurantibacillus circumpalustris]
MSNTQEKVLIIGAGGQIGVELTENLSKIYGENNVVASDLRKSDVFKVNPFEVLDALNKDALFSIVKKHNITQIYHLAAMLSATGEQNPMFAWKLNMESLFHVLDLAKEKHIKQIYWPSSIAVFGPTTPQENTPQFTVMEPSTIYGISKQAGERWCEWYFKKHGVDVRSLRYPGLIGWKSAPGGGTTDYAVHIFHEALKNSKYESFLSENTALPMMHMEDAIRATIEIMHAPSENIKLRGSYNLSGISFSPKDIATEIKKHIPNFSISYKPDFRQAIADSWPKSIDDSFAQKDWGWKVKYDLPKLVENMLVNLKEHNLVK